MKESLSIVGVNDVKLLCLYAEWDWFEIYSLVWSIKYSKLFHHSGLFVSVGSTTHTRARNWLHKSTPEIWLRFMSLVFSWSYLHAVWSAIYHDTVVCLSAEMLSPGGQSGLEAKFLASVSASKLRPWPCPQTFGLGLASVCSSQEETDQSVCRLQDITQWYM